MTDNCIHLYTCKLINFSQFQIKHQHFPRLHWPLSKICSKSPVTYDQLDYTLCHFSQTQGRTKTTSWISEKQMKLKLNTDKTNQVRQWFWWPIERQQQNDMAVQMITGTGFQNF